MLNYQRVAAGLFWWVPLQLASADHHFILDDRPPLTPPSGFVWKELTPKSNKAAINPGINTTFLSKSKTIAGYIYIYIYSIGFPDKPILLS